MSRSVVVIWVATVVNVFAVVVVGTSTQAAMSSCRMRPLSPCGLMRIASRPFICGSIAFTTGYMSLDARKLCAWGGRAPRAP